MSDTNRGAILTRQYLSESGQKQADLARVCKVSDVTALNWLRCSMKPKAPRRKIIARWSHGHVPAAAWDEAVASESRAA